MSVCNSFSVGSEEPEGPRPPETPVSTLEQELKNIDESGSWSVYYERIQNVATAESCKLSLTTANESQNRWKNRYRDIIPYDSTRVKLACSSTGDYINANYVQVIEVPNRRFILTQGPLLQTAGHFWEMVWEQNCPVIIMLNRFTERGTLKCFEYFPANSETLIFADAKLTVSCISETPKGLYVLRNFRITSSTNGESHEVLHFHYTRWPDFGVPDYSSSMLNFLWDVRRSGVLDNPDRPPVVHCSAGVGRSGTFVLIDLALEIIEKKNSLDYVSLSDLLIQLRQCRMGVIQTAQQLRYSYLAVVDGGKVLLGSPPDDRASLVFPEQVNHLVDTTEDETDSDDEGCSDDNDGLDEIDIQDDEREIIKHLRLQAAARGVSFQPNYLFGIGNASASSSSSTSEGEGGDEEIMKLFNQPRRQRTRTQSYNNRDRNTGTVEIEEVHEIDSGFGGSATMTTNNANITSNQLVSQEELQTQQPTEHLPSTQFTIGSERSLSGDADTEGEEGEDDEMRANAALESIILRKEARRARQAQTRTRLAEISAKMRAKDIMRRRWLPSWVARPLQRWFIQSGYVNNLTEAALFLLGVISLLGAVGIGLLWSQTRAP